LGLGVAEQHGAAAVAYSQLASTLVRQLPAGFESKVEWLLKAYVFAPALYDPTSITPTDATGTTGAPTPTAKTVANEPLAVRNTLASTTPGAALEAYTRTVFRPGPLRPGYVEQSKSRAAALGGGRTSLLLPARTQAPGRLFLAPDWAYLPLREFAARCQQADLAALPGTVRVFRQTFPLEDAVEFHGFAPLEALPCV
jgi:hypothetical protein